MSDSADRATPVEQAKTEATKGDEDPRSVSDWAEFGNLIRKLDDEYAEALAGPLQPPLEKPKPTGQ